MPAPLGPVIPIRSRALTCRDAGPEREVAPSQGRLVQGRHDGAGPGRRADAELQRPLLARLVHLDELGDARLHLPHLLRLLLGGLDAGLAPDLVVVGVLLDRVAHALRAPLALDPGAPDEVGLLLGELVVGLAGVTTRHRPLLQEGVVAAVVHGHLVLREVELDDAGRAAGQELPVVGDQHHAAAQAADERFEALEPGQVEVVGRLVEQHDVEAAQQECRQRRPRRLPPGQRGHGGVRANVETELGQRRGDPLVQVGGTAGQPVVQRDGVGVVGTGHFGAERRGGRLHGLGGLGRAGTAGEVAGHGLAGDPLVLLGQPADERVRRGGRDRPVQRRHVPRQQPQQRGLAGTVGAHHPDDVSGRDHQVQGLEQAAVTVAPGQVPRHEGCTHVGNPIWAVTRFPGRPGWRRSVYGDRSP